MKCGTLAIGFASICLAYNLFGGIPIAVDEDALPASVNNGASEHFRPIFNQTGNSCGSANGVGYVFTYEWNALRGTAADEAKHQFPYLFTHHMLNDGDKDGGTHRMFLDAWHIIQDNGIPNVMDFGGFTDGFPTKWANGYDIYYEGMHNRVDQIDSIDMTEEDAIIRMKQWMVDHGRGDEQGGVFTFNAMAYGVQETNIREGAEVGKTIIPRFGTRGEHAYALVGYNDEILFDLDRDGSIGDDETGAFILANSWGPASFDMGFAYVPYAIFSLPDNQSGIISDNKAYFHTQLKDYKPTCALKFSIESDNRSDIALAIGVSATPDAEVPDTIKRYDKLFTYAGGHFPMEGDDMSSVIEIGLDVSQLAILENRPQAKFFLVVDSDGGSGNVKNLTFMDYSEDKANELPSSQDDVDFDDGTTYIGVVVDNTHFYLSNTGIKHTQTHSDLKVRQFKNRFQIRLPITGKAEVRLTGIRGKVFSTIITGEQSRWATLPHPVSRGIYMLQITGREGQRWTKRVARF